MKQELIQVKKQLTFEDITPYWFDKLTGGQRWISDNVHIDIDDCKYCVVGEAHGFKDVKTGTNDKLRYLKDYGCEECNGFSFGGMEQYLSSGAKRHDCFIDLPRKLTAEQLSNHPLVQAFVAHWNECHVKSP